jgi:hypothetical protein
MSHDNICAINCRSLDLPESEPPKPCSCGANIISLNIVIPFEFFSFDDTITEEMRKDSFEQIENIREKQK